MRYIIFLSVFIMSCSDITVHDIKLNYFEKEEQLHDLTNYFTRKLPHSYAFSIEFRNDLIIRKYGITKIDKKSTQIALGYNTFIFNNDFKESLNTIGWTIADIQALKQKLDNCNVISIRGETNDRALVVGYRRSVNGGIFEYILAVPNEGFTEGFKKFIENRCSYIMIDSTAVISYKSGVSGSDCLPKN